MMIKLLHEDRESWGIFDNVEKVRYSHAAGDFVVLIEGMSGDSDGRCTIDDYQIVNVSSISVNDRFDKNKLRQYLDDPYVVYDVMPDVVILDPNMLRGHDISPVNWIIARMSNGEEKLLVFNTLGYILNDQGKTVEKINETRI